MRKDLFIIGFLIFVLFLYLNFSKENSYNSYARNIYYNFLGIFTKNNTLEVNYSNDELEIQELKNSISELKE